MRFEAGLQERVATVLACETDIFNELVAAAGLDPTKDFRYADLSEVDFSGANLEGFDFSRADLRRAIWRDCEVFPIHTEYALLGRGDGALSGADFERIVDVARTARTWADRFFAFTVLVDNFGESHLILRFLSDVVGGDKSKYMRFCSYVYFSASFLNSKEARDYCISMANSSSSRVNMFRFSRVRRYADEFSKYLREYPEKLPRFPSEAGPREISALYFQSELHRF